MQSSSTREKRERLFRNSRPFIRQFDFQKDMWLIWAAYDLGSFPYLTLKGTTKEEKQSELIERMKAIVSVKSSCLIVEDDCRWFKDRRGPVAFVGIENYGWRVEPHVDFFKWASPRTILRCNVAFFQMARYSSQVGVCLVRALEKYVPLFDHLKTYGLLFPCGKVPDGDPRGDEYLYQVRGRKEGYARTHGIGRNVGDTRNRGRGEEDPGAERDSDVPRSAVLHSRREDRSQPAETSNRVGAEREVRAQHAEAIGA